MAIPNQLLQQLIARLDLLGARRTLVDLADALAESSLQYSDIEPYVRTTEHSYTRNTVALREHYELLVLTWQGGQASVPHDHGGSICAMMTMRGNAVEGNYSVAADGYVDLEFEQRFSVGQITAGDDAAVHTVKNLATNRADLLVTVHIYSPPLRDFRRFVERPVALPHPSSANHSDVPTIAVVGGGFSGSICSTQLLRQTSAAGSPLRVLLIEQRGSIGEGLAYGTREDCHLLNVPAGRMSAFPDQPADFLNWAKARSANVSPDDFLPRQWYGEYVRQTLMKAADSAGGNVEFSVIFDEVRRIARHPDGGWLLNVARGTPIRADAVVLGIGHRAPSDPLGKKWTGPRTRFIADPWKAFAMNAVTADAAVLILGTGLTAVDAVMSLVERGHRGSITLLSRRGLLPQPHLSGHGTPLDLTPMVKELTAHSPLRALSLLRQLRGQVADATAKGIPWQYVTDGLRPHIADLWRIMPVTERRRFLSHLRAFWEVHRHRMPVPVAKRFHELLASGTVRILRGRAESVTADSDTLRVILRDRLTGQSTETNCNWIVNATGPSPSNSAAANPAIGSLLIQKLLCADELNLGVMTTSAGNAVATNGQPVTDLFVVGTLRKPGLWESTAVPELRQQAASTAAGIVSKFIKTPQTA
jgi:uncharacterized NAD(P)/FAD-binding protein YdhS